MGKNRSRIGLVVIALGLIVGAAVFAYRRIQITAERLDMSITYLTNATVEFIHKNHDWPKSWDDLAKVKPRVGKVEIPRDLDWVEKRVFVDFKADLREIAGQSPANFTGFGPKGTDYYVHRWSMYGRVIYSARQALPPATTK